ncbi:MAG: hypothetical protein ACK53Y_08875, partial [bacterium]
HSYVFSFANYVSANFVTKNGQPTSSTIYQGPSHRHQSPSNSIPTTFHSSLSLELPFGNNHEIETFPTSSSDSNLLSVLEHENVGHIDDITLHVLSNVGC